MLSSGENARPLGPTISSMRRRHGAEIGRDTIDASRGHVPLIGRERPARVGEVDRAVGLDDDVVRTQQALALEAVGDDRDAAVGLVRVTRRVRCSAETMRPCRSRVSPFASLVFSIATVDALTAACTSSAARR